MTIKTIKLKDTQIYKDLVKNKALRSASKIITDYKHTISDNDNTATAFPNVRTTATIIPAGSTTITPASRYSYSAADRVSSGQSALPIFIQGEGVPPSRDYPTGALYFNQSDSTLNIYDGEHWHSMQTQTRNFL